MKIKAQDEFDYLTAVFKAVGFSESDGRVLADSLTDADLRGISSHGIQRLNWYLNMIDEGTIKPQNKLKVLKDRPNSLLIDANQNMGQIACNFAMDELIQRAKQSVISIAVIRNSNHFGTAGYWARKAVQHGLIGIAMTNTRPLVVPTNALDAFLGSNAFAFTFPATPHPFVFDGATSIVAGGKIQVLDKKKEPIPGEWAVDKHHKVIRDANEAEKVLYSAALTPKQNGGGLLTLGGSDEINSNYKGFGNSLIVELLTGILAQGSISADTNIGKHDFSQCLITIDPSFFGDLSTLKAKASDMFRRIRELDHIPGKEIKIPGDREYKFYADNQKHGVSIDDVTFEQINNIAKRLNIKVPEGV